MTKPNWWVCRACKTVYGESPGSPVVDGPEVPALYGRAGTSGVALGRVVQAHDAGRVDEPEPDAMIGTTRGWLPKTVDAWNAERPGRGAGGGRPRTRS